jgi:hypothetical protein
MSRQTNAVSDVWLTRTKLARHLNLSVRQVDYMTVNGELPCVLFGTRTKRYHRESIDRLLLERQVGGNGKDQ